MTKKFNPVAPENRLPISRIHPGARQFLPVLVFGDGKSQPVPAPKRARKYDAECWIRSDKLHDRYSQVAIPAFMMKDGKSRKFLASRLAYYLTYGKDPGDKYVCHRCDRPKCINGAHLFLATPGENILDAVHKGRRGYRRYHPATMALKAALFRSLTKHGFTNTELKSALGIYQKQLKLAVGRKL